MTLKTRFILVLLSLFAVFTLSLYLVYRTWIYTAFEKLEFDVAGDNMQRVVSALDTDLDHLASTVSDWAAWNDTFEFVNKPYEAYYEANLDPSVFPTTNTNLFAIVSTDNRIVWSGGYDLINDQPIEFQQFAQPRLAQDNPLTALNQSEELPPEDRKIRGLLETEHGYLVLAAGPILRSDLSGPSRGFLVMGRLLNKDVITGLAERNRVSLEIHRLDELEQMHATPLLQVLESNPGKPYIYVDKANNSLNIYKLLRDLKGRVALIMHIDLPRTITEQGQIAASYASAALFIMLLVTLVCFLYVINYWILRRLRSLNETIERIENTADYSIRSHLPGSDELSQLGKGFNRLIEFVADKSGELKNANQKLEAMANQDILTGVANRRRFDEFLSLQWWAAQREQCSVSLLMCDIDHFKAFNDHFGHQAGDSTLTSVAQIIDSAASRPMDLCCRYGGEEFGVVLGGTDEAGAAAVAERIQASLRTSRIAHAAPGCHQYVSLSIGVSTLAPVPGLKPETLISKADAALYRAKEKGRNRTEFSSSLDEE